jgi:hypothetical protein
MAGIAKANPSEKDSENARILSKADCAARRLDEIRIQRRRK